MNKKIAAHCALLEAGKDLTASWEFGRNPARNSP